MLSAGMATVVFAAVAMAMPDGLGNEPTTSMRPMPPGPVFGITTDDGYDGDALAASVANLPVTPTTRVVFDEYVPAAKYVEPVRRLWSESYVMGMLLDSFYLAEYSTEEYLDRTTEYLDAIGSTVDIWEVGNEVNGEWAGAADDVVEKVAGAWELVEARGLRSAMTLYYNPECWEDPANEMFAWAEANVPQRMREGLDYVWISYYEEDCEGQRFDAGHWTDVFSRLRAMFPGSAIGFGETGMATTAPVDERVAYVERYYGMEVGVPGYVGGNFWWYFAQDCVPWRGDSEVCAALAEGMGGG